MAHPFEIKQEELEADLSIPFYTTAPSPPPSPWVDCMQQDDYASNRSPTEEKPIFLPPQYREVPLSQSLRRQDPCGLPVRIGLLDTQSFMVKDPFVSPPSSEYPMSRRDQSRSDSPPRRHIPRPPNAFMIYRSELIKNRAVPHSIEHRQQNLSRLAGQCWNLLPPEEKEKYHRKAAEVLQEHQKQNPNYKFTPAPRGSRRAKGKAQLNSNEDEGDRIKAIREQYVRVLGPTIVAERKRKRKTRDRSYERSRAEDFPPFTNDDSTLMFAHPSNASSPASPVSARGDGPFFQPDAFPHATLPRRPSTSLGFASTPSYSNDGPVPFTNPFLNYTRPSSAAPSHGGLSTMLQGLDIAGGPLHLPLMPQSMPTYNRVEMSSLPPSPLPISFTPQSSPGLNFGGHTQNQFEQKIADVATLPFLGLAPSYQPSADFMNYAYNQPPFYTAIEYPQYDPNIAYPALDLSGYDVWKIVENPADDVNFTYTTGNMNPQ